MTCWYDDMMLRGYDHALFYHFCFASQYMAICLYTAIRVHNALWLYVAMLLYMDDLPFPWYVVIQWSAMNVCVHVKHFWDRCCNALTNYASHLNLYHSSCDEVGYQFGPWNLVLYYFIFFVKWKRHPELHLDHVSKPQPAHMSDGGQISARRFCVSKMKKKLSGSGL